MPDPTEPLPLIPSGPGPQARESVRRKESMHPRHVLKPVGPPRVSPDRDIVRVFTVCLCGYKRDLALSLDEAAAYLPNAHTVRDRSPRWSHE